jgi:hypothetical protein
MFPVPKSSLPLVKDLAYTRATSLTSLTSLASLAREATLPCRGSSRTIFNFSAMLSPMSQTRHTENEKTENNFKKHQYKILNRHHPAKRD